MDRGVRVVIVSCLSLREGTGMCQSTDTQGQQNTCLQMYNYSFEMGFCWKKSRLKIVLC